MKKIKKILYKLFLFLFSKGFYKIILKKIIIDYRHENNLPDNAFVIFYPHAIGDVFNLSLFISSFKKSNNLCKVYIFTKEYIKSIESHVKKLGVDGIYKFEKKSLILLKLGGKIWDYENRIFLINHTHKHKASKDDLSFLNYFPKLLNLEFSEIEFSSIIKENFLKLADSTTKNKIKKAILFPYPGTLEKIDTKYWEKIVEILEKNNVEVYTNVINKQQMPIERTIRLELSLDKITQFVNNEFLIIARRNGLNDVFTFNNCKQIIFYNCLKPNELMRYSIKGVYSKLSRDDFVCEIPIEIDYDPKYTEIITSEISNMLKV